MGGGGGTKFTGEKCSPLQIDYAQLCHSLNPLNISSECDSIDACLLCCKRVYMFNQSAVAYPGGGGGGGGGVRCSNTPLASNSLIIIH